MDCERKKSSVEIGCKRHVIWTLALKLIMNYRCWVDLADLSLFLGGGVMIAQIVMIRHMHAHTHYYTTNVSSLL